MKKITQHLGIFYKKQKEKSVLDDQTLFYTFTKVVREDFGQYGTKMFIPQYFGKGTLIVYVEKSTWAQELWVARSGIMQKINHYLNDEIVKKISITNNKEIR